MVIVSDGRVGGGVFLCPHPNSVEWVVFRLYLLGRWVRGTTLVGMIICCPSNPRVIGVLVHPDLQQQLVHADNSRLACGVKSCCCPSLLLRPNPACRPHWYHDGCLFFAAPPFLNLRCFDGRVLLLLCLCVGLLAAIVEEKRLFEHDQGRSCGGRGGGAETEVFARYC